MSDLQFEQVANIKAVSYTHLDVYKRQTELCRKDNLFQTSGNSP